MSLLWKSDQEDGTYKNPILFADYSDPDVIRVGDIYYMTESSFTLLITNIISAVRNRMTVHHGILRSLLSSQKQFSPCSR